MGRQVGSYIILGFVKGKINLELWFAFSSKFAQIDHAVELVTSLSILKRSLDKAIILKPADAPEIL